MQKIIHIYKSKEEKDSAIDRVWSHFDDMGIGTFDYETHTFYDGDNVVLQIWLSTRIQYLPGIGDKVKSWMVPL